MKKKSRGRPKLTKAQKRKNATQNKIIRNNYNIIRQNYPNKLLYMQYKNRVEAMMAAKDYTVRKAVAKVNNTETFISPAERSRTNLLNALKEKYTPQYKTIKNLMRDEKGRFISLEDINRKLKWTKTKDKWGYTFMVNDSTYLIDVSNSPKGVEIIEIQK